MQQLKNILVHAFFILCYTGAFFGSLLFEIQNNLFTWSPEFTLESLLYLLIPITSSIFIFLLFKKIVPVFATVTNVLYGLLVIIFCYTLFSDEVVSDGFLGRSELSPLWFKSLLILLLVSPLIAYFIYLLSQSSGSKEPVSE